MEDKVYTTQRDFERGSMPYWDWKVGVHGLESGILKSLFVIYTTWINLKRRGLSLNKTHDIGDFEIRKHGVLEFWRLIGDKKDIHTI